MKSLLIQNKDLVLTANKFIVNDSIDAIAQNIENFVRINKSEWFGNATTGLDYFNWNNLNLNDNQIKQSIVNSLALNKNILSIKELTLIRDRQKRTLQIKLHVESVLGTVAVLV